jgi:1-acyl-sn-glycerol-3-phosphate acyltransferase
MIVANHVSWVDIFAINAVVPVRFVAKAQVRRWPLVGWLSARAGTIFIDRGRRQDTLRVNALISQALRAGELFAVFPEGTTSDGSTLLKFHSSLLEPALEAGAAVQPVALRYEREDGSLCTEAAYDGTRSAWDALIGIVSQRSVIVHVCMLRPIMPGVHNRRALALHAWDAIHRTLHPETPGSDTERVGDLEAVAQ